MMSLGVGIGLLIGVFVAFVCWACCRVGALAEKAK